MVFPLLLSTLLLLWNNVQSFVVPSSLITKQCSTTTTTTTTTQLWLSQKKWDQNIDYESIWDNELKKANDDINAAAGGGDNNIYDAANPLSDWNARMKELQENRKRRLEAQNKPQNENENEMMNSRQSVDNVFNQVLSNSNQLSQEEKRLRNEREMMDAGGMFLRQEDRDAIRDRIDKVSAELRETKIRELKQWKKQYKQEIEENQRRLDQESEQTKQFLMKQLNSVIQTELDKTADFRKSTKLAAQADRSMVGKPVRAGSWGQIGDYTVLTSGTTTTTNDASATLGSTTSAQQQQQKDDGETKNKKILMIANPNQDPIAKTLLPALQNIISETFLDVPIIETFSPFDEVPLGGNNANVVIFFLSSLVKAKKTPAALEKMLRNRLLKRTMTPDGLVNTPPTQLVAISSLGTERTNKLPYSMQNLMSGGQLDQIRLLEQALIKIVQTRQVEMGEVPLDYTIIKLGELVFEEDKKKKSIDFALEPGDGVDGTIQVDTAAKVTLQAMAFEPTARNATLSVVGSGELPSDDAPLLDWTLSDAFLKLQGPELMRMDIIERDDLQELEHDFNVWVEAIANWAQLLVRSKKLTTPCMVEWSDDLGDNIMNPFIMNRQGIKLVFQPTNTGRNYISSKDERERGLGSVTKKRVVVNKKKKKNPTEGGVEILVEMVQSAANNNAQVRIRARRCNMADRTVIKQKSEETILSQLKQTVGVIQQKVQEK